MFCLFKVQNTGLLSLGVFWGFIGIPSRNNGEGWSSIDFIKNDKSKRIQLSYREDWETIGYSTPK